MTAHATSTPVDDAQHWRQDAACAELPDTEADRIFFAGNGATYAEARVWCGGCPVVTQCRDDARATREEYGFRGGETARARKATFPQVIVPLTAVDADLIRSRRQDGLSHRRLAAEFGRSTTTVARVLRGEVA